MSMVHEVAVVRLCGQESDHSYHFRGARGHLQWPTSVAELAAAGAWNFLARLGVRIVEPYSRVVDIPASVRLIFVCLSGGPNVRADLEALLERSPESTVVVTGEVTSLASLDGIEVLRLDWTNGLAASLGEGTGRFWLGDGRDTFRLTDNSSCWRQVGRTYRISGIRQEPDRAVVTALNAAPLAVDNGRFIVVNGNPFGVLQGLLQGAVDLSPWLNWYPRLWWLDEYCSALRSLILALVPPPIGRELEVVDDSLQLVLRHDLDWSRDTTFLEHELSAGLPATYAVLDDRNAEYWSTTLHRSDLFESALHYDTGATPSVLDRLRARLARKVVPIRPEVGRIGAGGLARQLRRARRLGIGTATLHRHLRYLYYPEWIDALDAAAEDFGVLGGSSYFRGSLVRYSADDALSSTSEAMPPDALSPIWMPFRPWHSAARRLVRAWESASLIDPDLGTAVAVLDACKIRKWPAVVTLCYHPAHTSTPTLMQGGTVDAFSEVVRYAANDGWEFTTLEESYRRLHPTVTGSV